MTCCCVKPKTLKYDVLQIKKGNEKGEEKIERRRREKEKNMHTMKVSLNEAKM